MPQSSENLVKEILNGNEAAMELLVKQNYDMVQSFIYRYIDDYNTSYDMTQEVFIKMMKNLSRFKYENGNFKSYILKIASNQCRDYFRSSSYKISLESSDIYETDVESGELVIDILEKNEERLKVKKAVSSLPEKQREAVILKYFHDMIAVYTVPKVDDEKIDETIEVLKSYMSAKKNEYSIRTLIK